MTQDTKHTPTPTPWTAEGAALLDAEGTPVALVCSIGAQEQILRAVNAHEELVAALRRASGELHDLEANEVRPPVSLSVIELVDAALAKAEGEST